MTTTPPDAATLPDLLAEVARRAPGAPALVAGTERRTYAGLAADVSRAAGVLAGLGIGAGDHVGLLATNTAAWPAVALGAMHRGARVDAFHTWARAWDLAHLLAASGCAVLVLTRRVRGHDLLGELRSLVPELWEAPPGTWRSGRFPALREVVVLDGDGDGDGGPVGTRRWSDLAVTDPGPAAADPIVPAFVMYTSGSTAAPKAVPLVHRDLVVNGFWIGERMGLSAADRVWLGSPLFWSFGGANALLATLTHGACLVLQEHFEPGPTTELLVAEQVTAAYLLPSITAALLPGAEPVRAAGFLRTGLTIGRPEEIRQTAQELGAAEICNIYGSTETYGNCCVTPHDWPLDERAVSQGPPLPGVELRVVDDDGAVRGPGHDGELQVRGRVMPGYLDAPEATADVLTDDGWFRTGDRLHLRDDGAVQFAARLTEMIKTSGINVAPAEVESYLARHPDVAEVAVVGAPHPERGEVVVAFVSGDCAPGDGPALREWCRQGIAGFKVPWEVVVLDALPHTDTGKPRRRELAAQAAERVAGSA